MLPDLKPTDTAVNHTLWPEVALLYARLGASARGKAIAELVKSQADSGRFSERNGVRVYRGLALALLDAGEAADAIKYAAQADGESVEQIVKLSMAKDVAATAAAAAAASETLAPPFRGEIQLALAKAVHDPRPLTKFDDPRPRKIDKASLTGIAVKPADETDKTQQWIAMLTDANPQTRERACTLLSTAGADSWPGLPVLTNAFMSDSSQAVQNAARLAMREILTQVPGRFVIRKPSVEVFTAVLAATHSELPDQSRLDGVKCLEALLALAEPAVIDAVLPKLALLAKPAGYDDTMIANAAVNASPAAVLAVARGIAQPDDRAGQGSVSIVVRISSEKDVSAAFTELLKDPNPIIRKRLVTGLENAWIHTPQTMASLLPLLQDRDAELRAVVSERIRLALTSTSASERKDHPLKGVEQAVPTLKAAIEAVRNDSDYATRKSATEASDFLRTPLRPDGTRATRPGGGNDARDRPSLAEAMRILKDEQQSSRSKIQAVAFIEHKDMAQALTSLGRGWMSLPVKARFPLATRVRDASGSLKNAKRHLQDILKVETDRGVRPLLQSAMIEIENIEDREATAAAAGAGKGPNKGVREPFDDPFNRREMDEAAALTALANAKSSASLKAGAIITLRHKKSKDPRAYALFRAALKHRHWSVRYEAAKAIGAAGDAGSLPALLAATDDWSDDVRRFVVRAAVAIDPDSEELLKTFAKLTDDPVHDVQYAVNQVLADHGSQEAMLKLIAGQWRLVEANAGHRDGSGRANVGVTKAKARWTAEQMKAVTELPPALIAGLTTPDHRSRQPAALELVSDMGGIGHSATPILLKLVRSPNDEIRRRAAEALGAIARDNADVLKSLAELVTDPTFAHRSVAFDALRGVGEQAKTMFPLVKERLAGLPKEDQDRLLRSIEYYEKNQQEHRSAYKQIDTRRYDVPADWH